MKLTPISSQRLTNARQTRHKMHMDKIRKLCVYCGSGPGVNPVYMAAARTLGTAMAKANIGLVYGGGSLGLMGETARAVLKAGGHVTGIIPEFLIKQEMMLLMFRAQT